MIKNIEERKDCPMRHECGNCMVVGGFCMDAVSDEICHAMHQAYDKGRYDTLNTLAIKLRKQPEIVQCKDCKHYRQNTIYPRTNAILTYCALTENLRGDPYWFCADGERKELEGEA